MKAMFFILFCLILVVPMIATQVSGTQSGTWTVTDNPYILISDVTVPAGQSLILNPGVIVQSQGNYQIIVQGLLSAIGSQADTIRFSITSDNAGNIWKGLRFENLTGMNELSFCDIRFAENGANIISAPVSITDCHFYGNTIGINCSGIGYPQPAPVIITRCLIEYSKNNGIFIVENHEVLITDCNISNNGVESTYQGAIQLSIQSNGADCSPRIRSNHIHHNRWQGITGLDSTGQGIMQPVISDNIIEYNYSGIYLLNADGQVLNNQICNNFIPGNMNSGAGIMVGGAASAPLIYRNTITGNYQGIYLANNANPCIGDLTEDVLSFWGRNTISNNIDANGTLRSIVLYQYTDSSILVKAENNSWGTEDTLAIAQSITDHADNPTLGTVDFMPLETPGPLQSISGIITPIEGMLGCQIVAVPVNDPTNIITTQMNVDHTYQIPLESPGVYYVTAYGNRFEDIIPSMCGTYGNIFDPQAVEIWLLDHAQNIDITMHPFPAYMFSRMGASFQQDNLTVFPFLQGIFVTPNPIVMNLFEDNTTSNILIHSFTDSSSNPPNTITLTSNNVLIPKDNIEIGDSWASSRMISNNEESVYELINVNCTVTGAENILFNDVSYQTWIIETRTQENALFSTEWYAFNLGVMRAKFYHGPFIVYKMNLQSGLTISNDSYMPLIEGNKWFYQYTMPIVPNELTYMPGDATNFFSWEPPTQGEVPWTHYKFYEDDVMLAQLPITQTNYGVLQDFYHTHRYYVTAWREGWESSPSNIVTIEGVPNSDDTETPILSKLSIYPNPCNLSSTNMNIKFNMQKTEPATMTIYNIRGQKVRTLHFNSLAKGSQTITWDGRNDDHKQVVDGVYLVKMDLNKKSITQKVVLIK